MATFKISRGLQASYDALQSKDNDTIYVCTDTGSMYLGSKELYEQNAFIDVSISDKTITFNKRGKGTTPYPTKTLSLSDFATTQELSDAISTALSSALVYKGSCTYAELPTTGQKKGDMWNVTDAHGTTPAGTNYAWDGEAWDPLGGVVDLSNFKTKQTAKTDPSSSGTAVDFIATITQNANGEITATKKAVRNASGSQSGLMSSAHYTKLEGVAAGAQVNVLEAVKINGTALSISSKAVNIVTESAYNESTNKIATMSDVQIIWGSF